MANKQAWKNGVNTQFRGNSAVKAQEKAAETQRNNGRLRRAAEELVTPEVAMNIIKAHIDKSLAGDAKSTEIIRDLLGEKPTDTMEINGGEPFSVEIRVIE